MFQLYARRAAVPHNRPRPGRTPCPTRRSIGMDAMSIIIRPARNMSAKNPAGKA
ncbi:hypothetical protein GDI0421 [Gluconacetobacter diazotrophicus PA1 5]|uniref:Uncharacterized protein n=1 Tax=Gluconacetobacter diazotrophicus (strain ATCC 49037 / DSM 5601 / CCUG 37298 / CIP 103539 / LMG 7603 / PAl5) TaxID=272568 RepID=A9H5Q8_GLUDA|nr:hypothetical protein GDI0421 [Gluconacetobacter diazotrophicus PA1 5]